MTEVCFMICWSFRKSLNLLFGLWSIVLKNINLLLSSYILYVVGIHIFIHFGLVFTSNFLCGCPIPRSCLTLCNPMGYSMPGSSASTISPYLFRFMSFVLVMLSNHLILCCPVILCLPSFPASGSFPVSQLFISGGQNIGDLAAVFPMNSHIFPKFSSVIQLYLTICNPWTVARQTSLFITNSWS